MACISRESPFGSPALPSAPARCGLTTLSTSPARAQSSAAPCDTAPGTSARPRSPAPQPCLRPHLSASDSQRSTLPPSCGPQAPRTAWQASTEQCRHDPTTAMACHRGRKNKQTNKQTNRKSTLARQPGRASAHSFRPLLYLDSSCETHLIEVGTLVTFDRFLWPLDRLIATGHGTPLQRGKGRKARRGEI